MSTTCPAVLKPCCVCGKETGQRCSACAKVGIELFFCSPEHQKLVWQGADFKVCGDKAHPFYYPDMTAAEIKLVEQYKDVDNEQFMRRLPLFELDDHMKRHNLPSRDQVSYLTLGEMLSNGLGFAVEDFDEFVLPLLQDSKSLSGELRHQLLSHARAVVASLHGRAGDAAGSSYDNLRLGPWYLLAQIEAHFQVRYFADFGGKQVALLLHHVLTFFRLAELKKQTPSPPGFDPSFPYQTARAFFVACFEILPFKLPSEVHTSVELLRAYIQPKLDFRVSYGFKAFTFQLDHFDVYPVD
ncbi:hypothetical protein JCM8097_007972 [Rhodosporidiobolus ruineniae]